MLREGAHLPLPVLLVLDDVLQLRIHLRQRRIEQLGPLQHAPAQLSPAMHAECPPQHKSRTAAAWFGVGSADTMWPKT